MAHKPKISIATGNKEADEREAKRLREREEEGLEPEKRVGARQNEGISTAGHLYATEEEAEDAHISQGERPRIDRDAAHVHKGDPPVNE